MRDHTELPLSLAADLRARVIAAIVTIKQTGGQGVLVPGGFILTATHCIDWSGTGGMVLGDYYLETVVTKSGAQFRVSPWFADPLADLAALGEADNQTFYADCEAFEAWRESVEPIRLSDVRLESGRIEGNLESFSTVPPVPRRVHVLTHKGEWIVGRVVRYDLGPPTGTVTLETEAPIEEGMSGGPVVDDLGHLVGVVSIGTHVGSMPIAHMALPRWVLERIETAD